MLFCGCFAHTQERIENAATGAGHQAALEKCLSDANDQFKIDHDQKKAIGSYTTCADAADKKYGKK